MTTPSDRSSSSTDCEAPRWAARFMNERVAFHRLLGMRVTQTEAGRAHMTLPFREDLTGDPFRPALHGGALATLADAAGGTAVMTLLRPVDRVSTIDLRVDYLRPAQQRDLLARAEVQRLGGRVAVVAVDVVHPEQESPSLVVAVARAVYAVRRAEDEA